MKESILGRRIAAIVLCLALIAGITPSDLVILGTPAARAEETGPTPIPNAGSLGMINTQDVNFRKEASSDGESMMKFDKGDVVTLVKIPEYLTREYWFQVSKGSLTGYVQANFIDIMTVEESQAWLAANPGQNVNAVTPTPAPTSGYVIPSRILRKDDTGDDVKSVQARLIQLGYAPGTADGKYGDKTVTAIAAFQRKNGLKDDGKCGPATTAALFSDSAVRADGAAVPTPSPTPVAGYVIPTRTLRKDDTGDDVKSVQKRLIELGYKPGSADGKYGEKTVEAVTAFQKKNGLTQDGKCGDQTTAALFSVNAVHANQAAVTATPAPGVTSGYVRLTESNVNLRKSPAGDTIAQLKKGTVLPYIGTPTTVKSYTWYYVKTADGRAGYVRNDCLVETDANGAQTPVTTPVPGTTPTPAPTSGTSSIGYIKLSEKNVNLRKTPAGLILERVEKAGTILPLVANPTVSGKFTWYPVKNPATGRTGYIRGDCADPCDANGNPITSGATPTPAPGGSYAGYIMLTQGYVNLRRTAGGATIASIKDKGTVLPMTANAVSSGSYLWYPVDYNGRSGFIRGDVCVQLTQAQIEAYLAGKPIPDANTTPAPSGPSAYLITILNDVNLRASASKDAAAAYNVPTGTVFAYTDKKTVGGEEWYEIVYNNTKLWVLSSCVRIMTIKEYEDWLASAKPTVTPPTDVAAGYVKLIKGGVNFRNSPNGGIMSRLDKGLILPYLEAPVSSGKYMWYKVKSPQNVVGYVRSDTLEVTDSSGKPVASPTPVPTGGSGTKPEASYSTLKVGSKGTAVKALVTALKEQGYYTGSITDSYNNSVRDAVKAYQKAHPPLAIDGIAGSQTQHSLYGTVPIGTYDEDIPYTLNPVEKIDWFTGGIQSIFARGTIATVVDVKTGIAFHVKRWAGGNHADVEPLTAADTRRMCKIYGVSTAQEIVDKDLWQRRPLWVIVGGRTFCASMYGIPHNYPDGDTIANNDFKGQFCIHFTNSRTHGSNILDTNHQTAIQYAYEHAPSRK